MIDPTQLQLVVQAARHFANMSNDKQLVERGKLQLEALHAQLDAERDMMQMRVESEREYLRAQTKMFSTFVKSMIDFRVDAIKTSFAQVMTMFAEQSQHYMTQQETYTQAMIKSTDPLERAGYITRLSEIDVQLRRIRSDAKQVFTAMNRAIVNIGNPMFHLPEGIQSILRLN